MRSFNGNTVEWSLSAFLLSAYAVIVLTAVRTTHNGVGLGGAPLFYDFEAFFEAGRFALRGHAASAYDDARMIASQQAAFPGMTLKLPWNYPPTLQLLLTPLTALPYVPAWMIWSTGGYFAFIASLSSRGDRHYSPLMLLAPAAAINLFFGQNGLFTTALLYAGVRLLEQRPRVAGLLIGMLCCKPQLAVVAPILLMINGHWRALASAIASQALLVAVTLALFGSGPWFAFLAKMLHPTIIVSASSSDWRAIPSIMTLARTVGFPPPAASALHWLTAAVSVGVAACVWRRTADVQFRAVAAGAATLLVSPYLRSYDLALLAPAAALLAMDRKGISYSPRRLVEISVAALAWTAPALLMFTDSPIQYGAVITLATLMLVAWRLQGELPEAPNTPFKRPISGNSPKR